MSKLIEFPLTTEELNRVNRISHTLYYGKEFPGETLLNYIEIEDIFIIVSGNVGIFHAENPADYMTLSRFLKKRPHTINGVFVEPKND